MADGTVVRNVEAFEIESGNANDTFIVGAAIDYNAGGELNGRGGIDTLRANLTHLSDAISYVPSGPSLQGIFLGYRLDSIERYEIQGGSGNDTLTGAGLDDKLSGGHGDDTVSGNDGNDIVSGNGGHDMLTGGAGADKFVFNVSPGLLNADRIGDFVHGTDKIELENSVFRALGVATGQLADVKFYVGADAHDWNDRIIYNQGTGQLFYDDDGNGAHAKQLIATLDGHPVLTVADILVI